MAEGNTMKQVLAVGIIRRETVVYPYSDPLRTFTTVAKDDYFPHLDTVRYDGVVDIYGDLVPLARETVDRAPVITETKGIGQ